MKIWVTFNSVFSLQCGGLERCHIWWQRPVYHLLDRSYRYDDLPFGSDVTSNYRGLTDLGWAASDYPDQETGSVRLGKIFNYEGEICDLVWDKLCEFFQTDDLRQWDIQAKNLDLSPKDFCLELDIDMTLSQKNLQF